MTLMSLCHTIVRSILRHAYTGIIYSHWSEKGNSICANMRKSQDEESVYSCIADWKINEYVHILSPIFWKYRRNWCAWAQ